MVVWADGPHLKVARVSKEGDVLDPSGIPIEGPSVQYDPDISFGPENYLVVWWDGRGSWDIYGARVTPDGDVLDPGGFVVSTGNAPPAPPPPPPIEPPPPQPPPGPPPAPLRRHHHHRHRHRHRRPAATSPACPTASGAPTSRASASATSSSTTSTTATTPPPPIEPPPPPVCEVPRLIGLKLARARTFLRQNHCSVGSVKWVHVKRALRGKVVAQRPSRGATRANRFPVRLTVGRR